MSEKKYSYSSNYDKPLEQLRMTREHRKKIGLSCERLDAAISYKEKYSNEVRTPSSNSDTENSGY